MTIHDTNASSFQVDVLESDWPVIVLFHATWSGPCRMMRTAFNQAAEERDGSVQFMKLDVDQNEDVARGLQIDGVPVLLFYNEGKILDRLSGARSKQEIVQWIDKFI